VDSSLRNSEFHWDRRRKVRLPMEESESSSGSMPIDAKEIARTEQPRGADDISLNGIRKITVIHSVVNSERQRR
jgi:hypothetical protein